MPDIADGIKAELLTTEQLQISFSLPLPILDADGKMNALMHFSHDLQDRQGPLLDQ